MLARWILVLFLSVGAAEAIQRPETKSTLRSLTRMPRIEPRFSLDFDADRGFAAFQTAKDPSVAVAETREKIVARAGDGRLFLEIAGLRLDAGETAGARRDFQRAADALRGRLDVEPGNAPLRLDLASALHGLGRQAEAESILREAVKLAPDSVTNWMVFSAFLEAGAWEIAADTTNWRGRRAYSGLMQRMLRREPSVETADRAGRLLEESLSAAREAVRLDEDSAGAQHRLAISIASKEYFETVRRQMTRRDFAGPLVDTVFFTEAALPALERAAELEPENSLRLATVVLWRALATAADKRMGIAEILRRGVWDILPDADRRKVEVGLENLSALRTGAAAQALGTLRLVVQNDFRAATEILRDALDLAPESEQLWETLNAALARNEDYEELAIVCEARTFVRSSVRNRVLLAAAHERIGNRQRAVDELAAVVALNSNDFAANLGLATLLLREPGEENSARVRQALVNAERASRGNSSGAQLMDLALAQSVYHGLIDEPDRARDILKAALAYDKNDSEVAAALSAIGY